MPEFEDNRRITYYRKFVIGCYIDLQLGFTCKIIISCILALDKFPEEHDIDKKFPITS